MKSAHLARLNPGLPKRGNSLVYVTLVDENGFTYEYAEAEVPNGAVKTALATIYLEAKADSERRGQPTSA